MRKTLLITTLILTVLALTACTPKTAKTAPSSPAPPKIETQIPAEVLKNALNLYSQKKSENVDFSNGPCLGKIGNDWVLDIAHNPRQATDDKPQNQCADFKNGTAHHFIELDLDGKMIRAI